MFSLDQLSFRYETGLFLPSYGSVRPSVCLSHCSIIATETDLWSCAYHQTVLQRSSFRRWHPH